MLKSHFELRSMSHSSCELNCNSLQINSALKLAELFNPGILLDIIDDEWLMDELLDDDVPFPVGVTPPADEIDETSFRSPQLYGCLSPFDQEQLLANQDKWTDLGLRTIH